MAVLAASEVAARWGAFRTYRARGQCKYAYVTVTYGIVGYASTSENIFQTSGDADAAGALAARE
jgi:hypothetical protein